MNNHGEELIFEAGFNRLYKISGFPNNILAELKLERSSEHPPDQKQINTVTVKYLNDTCFLEVNYGNWNKNITSFDLSNDEIEKIFELAENIKPVEPDDNMGCTDGVLFYLTVSKYDQTLKKNVAYKFDWWGWNYYGKSWKEVGELAEYLWVLAEEKLY